MDGLPSEFMRQAFDRARYERALVAGAEQYRDVLDFLQLAGIDARFTQTGGMCAAIEAPLENGTYLLVTDFEDSLSWERDTHQGWMVGVYDNQEWEDARVIEATEDGSLEALVGLVERALQRR